MQVHGFSSVYFPQESYFWVGNFEWRGVRDLIVFQSCVHLEADRDMSIRNILHIKLFVIFRQWAVWWELCRIINSKLALQFLLYHFMCFEGIMLIIIMIPLVVYKCVPWFDINMYLVSFFWRIYRYIDFVWCHSS